ncbi:hypothetical protein SAMN02745119_02727 [Trichlorobacter thiogenes]|uniref:Tetratricopeptide repeat protein n=1 Tax=Trichlorobacter thiogenes TaxID=115783 RepID=A0A1T4R7Z1_9BACT|nr:tetratricopeptide repeat protein [Trichlorobacter thiogenes]SKA11936.1 hypothetical protein SAMN02745119_02727 [Trichlorobacter thiogenes]
MRLFLNRWLLALCVLQLCSGCMLFNRHHSDADAPVPSLERQFATALQFLRQGNEQGARELLEQVVVAPGLAGVTDDALFRLALLKLRDGGEKGGQEGYSLLARLAKEYPDSIWTHQSAALTRYLSSTQKLFEKQRETRTVRELNLYLSRENKELRLNIEKLKKLDLELDLKNRR